MNKLAAWLEKFRTELLSEEQVRQAIARMSADAAIVSRAAASRLTTARMLGLSAAVTQAMLDVTSRTQWSRTK